ncbi:phage tail length tape measure family protein [Aureimonas psammosilenae]|uniref:phage tail length tape measure family protein n=1 Tax=Aureimonas psammosilenae TaxID=2495496 RepID=UPI001260F182|nr:phage tail length tape measure family protein [Aureimonas psammosilenae]
MTEAARVSIAIEATGLEKTTGDMAKLEKAGEKAAASVRASMGGIEKNMAAVEAMFTKATGEIVGAVTKLDANLSKSFAGLETSMAKAMKAMQANTAPATAAVQQMQTSVSSDLMQIGVVADKMAEAVRDSMGGIAPAVAEASAAISRSSQAMGAFDTASASMARSAAALETAVRGVAEMQAKLADQLARKPANDNPFQPQVKGADELRAKYDALFAIGLKYRKDVEEIRASHASGAISAETMGRMIAVAGERATATQTAYVRMTKHLTDAGDAARLSGGQVQGLSYQINDIGTMLAMGASPFQIIASQGGQIVQVLGDHPNGVRGSMKALGQSVLDVAAKIGPFGWGAAAIGVATVAAIGFSKAVQKAVPDMDEAFKKHDELLKQIEDRYGSLSDKVKGLANWQGSILTVTAGKELRDLKKILDDQVKEFQANVTGDNGILGRRSGLMAGAMDPSGGFALDLSNIKTDAVQSKLKPVEDRINELRAQLKNGGADVLKFMQDMDRMYAQAGSDEKLRKAIETATEFGTTLFEVETRTKQLRQAMWEAQNGVARFQTVMKQFNDLAGEIGSFVPSSLTDSQRIEQTYQQMMRLAKTEADERRAVDLRRKSLEELGRVETNRRSGYDLDVRAITARTAAEKASIAAERVRLELANDPELRNNSAEIERRAQEASNLSLKQSQFDLAEAMRQRVEAGQSQVEQAQMEIDLVGKSVGETARLRVEYDLMTAAKQAAKEAGELVDPSEIDAIKAQAAAIGEATEALDKLNFQRDVAFRLAQAGRSEQDQRIAAELNSSGIDFDSAEGQRRAGMLRYVEAVEKAGDATRDLHKATKDAFADMIDSIGQGEGVLDSLVSSFARLGQKLASAGFDKLFGDLVNPVQQQSASSYATQIGTVTAAMSKPTQAAQASAYTSSSTGLGSNSDLVTSLRWAANKLGTSAKDLATVISYETGGTFSPDIKGGAGGKHLGLIQFGPTEQKQYGAHIGQGVSDQMKSVVSYLQDRGFKQGMSLLDLYSTINAGSPGRYKASDANNGGAPGTVYDKVSYQMAGHQANADRLLGKSDLTRAVSDGSIDAQRKIANGAVPIPTQRPTTSENGISLELPAGMTAKDAFQGIGGLVGIAANGYQSGSAVGGGVGGIFSGAQLGSMIPGIGTVAGAAIGGVVGLVSGLFGGSSKKKEEKRQRQMAADDAWRQNHPQFVEFNDEINRVERGALSQRIMDMNATLAQYDELAKATKRGENTAQIDGARMAIANYTEFLSQIFRADLPRAISDLGKGQGLDTSFTKARDAVMAQADSYRGFMKDIEDAYAVPVEQKDSILAQYAAASSAAKALTNDVVKRGYDYNLGQPTITRTKSSATQADVTGALDSAAAKRDAALAEYEAKYGDAIRKRDEALAAATKAAQEGLLRIVSGDTVEQSDIEKAIGEAQGAASGLRTALVDLGMSADETAAAIDKALGQRMEKLRDSFTESLQDKINDLDGKGYLASVRDLIKQRDDLLKDASLVNVDTSLVDTFFTKQAQAFVDGAELTGGAFNDLIAAFPELTGKVKEFVEVISDETVKSGLSSFLSDRLADATSKRAEAESDLLSAYNESKDHLESYQKQIKDFLTGIRLSDDSPLSQKDQFLEAQTKFRDVQARAMSGDKDAQEELVSVSQSYLDEAKAYYASSESYFAAFNEVEGSLKSADTKATSQLDLLKDQVGSLIDISDNTKTIAEGITALKEAIAAQQKLQDQVDGGRSFGINKERNRLIDAGVKQLGLNFTGNYGLTNGNDEFLKWRLALPKEQLAAVDAVINQYIGINKQMGGLIPGFANGGIIGNGLWNKDSVLARYQNGGSVALAGGEMVISAPKVTPRTYPVLDAINRTGMVPANENSGSVTRAEFAELSQKIDRLTAVVAAGAQMTTDEIRRGNQIADDGVNAQKKALARKAS